MLSTLSSHLCMSDRHHSIFSIVLVDVALLLSAAVTLAFYRSLSVVYFSLIKLNSTASIYIHLYMFTFYLSVQIQLRNLYMCSAHILGTCAKVKTTFSIEVFQRNTLL